MCKFNQWGIQNTFLRSHNILIGYQVLKALKVYQIRIKLIWLLIFVISLKKMFIVIDRNEMWKYNKIQFSFQLCMYSVMFYYTPNTPQTKFSAITKIWNPKYPIFLKSSNVFWILKVIVRFTRLQVTISEGNFHLRIFSEIVPHLIMEVVLHARAHTHTYILWVMFTRT